MWKFDRFARDREDCAIYKGLLRRHGVEVISVSEPVDRESPLGILVEGFIEIQDQFYSARLAEEVKRGLRETTLEGFSTGARAPVGYRRREVPDPRGRRDRSGNPVHRITLEIEPTEAAVVRRIFEMYAGGMGYTRIVKRLNAEGGRGPRGGTWDGSAIREITRNDTYRGARVYGRIKKVRTAGGTRSKRSRPRAAWTVTENAHPAIIDAVLWERVAAKRVAVAKTYERYERHFAATRSVQTQSLLTGLLKCAVCGGNFAARPVHTKRGSGRYSYYGCAVRARRGPSVCQNATLLPQDAIEREVLEILQEAVLTPATLDRLLSVVNARLRAQAAVSRPRITELRKTLKRVDQEITNYTRAIAKGDFSSPEQALGAAEQRRSALQAELARLDGNQPAALQLTPAALERHLKGMTEKLRSGVSGKVREAIQQSVARILVGVDGSLTIETKPGGLLGVEGLPLDGPGLDGDPKFDHLILGPTGRPWRVIAAPPDRSEL